MLDAIFKRIDKIFRRKTPYKTYHKDWKGRRYYLLHIPPEAQSPEYKMMIKKALDKYNNRVFPDPNDPRRVKPYE